MTTSNRIAAFVILGLGFFLLPSAPPAEAAVGWSVGTQFSVGPLAFDLFFQAGRPDHYYYRTRQPLHYRGIGCSDTCYHRSGYDYHHATCPLVDFHFQRWGFEPLSVVGPIFYPRSYGYRDDGYRYLPPSRPYAPHYRRPGGFRGYPPGHGYRYGSPGRGYEHQGCDRRGHRHDHDWDSDSDWHWGRGSRYERQRWGDRGGPGYDRYDGRRGGRDTRPYRRPN